MQERSAPSEPTTVRIPLAVARPQREALVKTARTDKDGRFDFGVLQEGHYTFVIDWPSEYAESFDVEIKKLPRSTSSVKIDVSPVYPDCTGGHEFVEFSD
jgi:5-hydroxyisourate hydrolase-like protein (transthyretin family)